MKDYLINYFSDMIFKFYKLVIMSDNMISRRVISDFDKSLNRRKPIEEIRDELSSLKVEMIHIKNYLRKLEARETLKEEEQKKEDETYVKPEKGWFF